MVDPLFDLSTRTVVLTGGLGLLGSVYATALAVRGARVAVLDIDAQAPGRQGRFKGFEAHGRLLFCDADVTSRASLEAALQRVRTHWGEPNALINNAAIDAPPDAPLEENGPFETYPEKSWDRVMEVNVKGVLLASQVFGGAMAAAGAGTIVNIASIYGQVSPNQSIYEYRRQRGEQFFKPIGYSASKSALYNMTRYLATYWAPQGVRVNTLTLAGAYNHQEAAFLEAYLPHVPMGRMAHADEYVGPIVFLLSEASRYMTGADLVVDGGWTAW